MNRLFHLMVVLWAVGPIDALAQTMAVANQPQSGAAVIRLAYFSPQRAFSESVEGKAAQARLAALQAEKAGSVEAKNKALLAQQQALEQSATLLSESARAQRGKELDRFKIDVQRFIEDAQAELMGVQKEIESAFLAKLRPALEQVVKEKDLQFVFNTDEGTIMWADPSFDITSDIVKRISPAETPKAP